MKMTEDSEAPAAGELCPMCRAPYATSEDLKRAHDTTLPDEIQPWEAALCWVHMGQGAHSSAPGRPAQPPGLTSDDHPGGPLSRAERVLLRQLGRSAMQARTLIYGMVHVLGAIPGAQKIEAAHKDAVAALDRFCLAMKTRKQGAPFPDGEPKVNPPQAAP